MKHNTLTILALMLATSLSSHAAITMALRLDASELTAGAITTWEDSSHSVANVAASANSNDVTQTGSAQPTVVLAAQNGLSVVRFDGTDDYMDNSATSYTVGSVFAVAYHNATTFPAGGNGYQGLYGGDDSADSIYYTGTGSSNAWFGGELDSQYLNGASSTIALTNPSAFNLYSGTDDSPNLLVGQSIGKDRNIGARYWNGDIAEIIVYEEELSDFDRQGVEVYLDEKWGLGQNLATTYGAGTYNTDLYALSIAVPEPSSTALLGLGGLALMLRRKRS